MERPDPHPCPVTVLMALYQGARWLQPQLESIAAQDVDWRLIAADDGSTDAGPQLLGDFAAAHPGRVRCVDGPRQGAAANFRALLRAAPAGWVALADQDDVWRRGKLSRALDLLSSVPPERPALYCSRVTICGPDLTPLGLSRPVFPPSFRHALVQNLVQGNTVVLNPAALALVQAADAVTPPVVMHDWWLYQLVTGAGGKVIQDDWCSVLYRQHGANVVGANAGLRGRWASFRRMLSGDHQDWSVQTLAAMEAARPLLSDDARRTLDDFAALHRGTLPRRLAAMRRGGFVRQGGVSQAALWLAAALRRV